MKVLEHVEFVGGPFDGQQEFREDPGEVIHRWLFVRADRLLEEEDLNLPEAERSPMDAFYEREAPGSSRYLYRGPTAPA